MPQLTRLTGNSQPTLVSPAGYEVTDTGTATEAIERGQLVRRTSAGWSKLPAAAIDPHGVALKTYAAGQGGCDFLIQGEMDGFDMSGGLVPGTDLFPSASVAGGIQTEVVASAPVRMRATTANRIRVNFV